MSHTILLVQPGVKQDTRTYTDFESINECLEVGGGGGEAGHQDLHRL